MNDEPTAPRPEPANADERPSASLLVRCWLEPSATSDQPPALRGYVKNLKTGEEMFIKDLGAVGEEIRRSLESGLAGRSYQAGLARENNRPPR